MLELLDREMRSCKKCGSPTEIIDNGGGAAGRQEHCICGFIAYFPINPTYRKIKPWAAKSRNGGRKKGSPPPFCATAGCENRVSQKKCRHCTSCYAIRRRKPKPVCVAGGCRKKIHKQRDNMCLFHKILEGK